MSSSKGLPLALPMCLTVLAVAFLATRWIITLRLDTSTGAAAVNYHNSEKLFTVIKSEKEVDEYPPFNDGAIGPESLAFDGDGEGPYVGLSNGRIVKWVENQRRWIHFAFTSNNRDECGGVDNKPDRDHEDTEHICGRPLGLCFHFETGNLYIADAYLGLLVVGREGGLAQTVPVHGGNLIPSGFVNGLDIDQTHGIVYFTESSTRFSRRSYSSAIITGDSTGRLLRYDIKHKQLTLLLTNLTFPNGVSLTRDNQSILLAESTNCRILRYWPPHNNNNPLGNGKLEVFADNLIGYPDNIKRMKSEDSYWVGVYTKRTWLAKWALARPWIGEAIVSGRPLWLKMITDVVRWRAVGMAVKLDEEGRVVEVLEDESGKLKFISEVDEKNGRLVFGSVIMPSLSLYRRTDVVTNYKS